jgi:hypothetical protein
MRSRRSEVDAMIVAPDAGIYRMNSASVSPPPYPPMFPEEGKSDPVKFLRARAGPTCDWFCDATVANESSKTRAYRATFAAAKRAAGNPARVDIDRRYYQSRFKFGYFPADEEAWRWLDGCRYQYVHEGRFGVTPETPGSFPETMAPGAQRAGAACIPRLPEWLPR